MKHSTSTELAITPKPMPESFFLRKMNELEDKIAHRAYDIFASTGFTDGHDLEDWLFAEDELFGQMPIEVTDNEKEVTVKAALPGFTEKDVEISVDPRHLFISGSHEEKSQSTQKGNTIYSDFSGEMYRAIDLPADVNPSLVKATFSKGNLDIILPKKTPGRHVPIAQRAA